MQSWLSQIEQHANENVLKILVATKCDDTDHRQVSEETAQAFANEHGLQLYFTSAQIGTNVAEAFDAIAKIAVEKQATSIMQRGNSASGGTSLSKGNKGKKSAKCCNV